MKSFYNFSFPSPENYAYLQSFSVGIGSAFCTFLVDTLTFRVSPIMAPVITFTAGICVALFYLWPTEYDNEKISFKNYKINYKDSLGGGHFGQVYSLVPRPENEKGYLSNLFPYIYDYFYPINNDSNKQVDDKYCVKVQLIRQSDFGTKKIRSLFSLFQERYDEKESNRVLRIHGMTNINFYTSNCFFSQIKKRIHGKTINWHLNNNTLTNPENYLMREKFVSFYRFLAYSNLRFADVNYNNIMYDEREKRWEIIDGTVVDIANLNEGITYKFSRYMNTNLWESAHLQSFDTELSTWVQLYKILELLRKVALSKKEYTQMKDNEIFETYVKYITTDLTPAWQHNRH